MWKMFVKEDRADCATLTASFPISKPIDMSSGVEARDAAYVRQLKVNKKDSY